MSAGTRGDGRVVMDEPGSSDEPGRQLTSDTNRLNQDRKGQRVTGRTDEAALTSHFDSVKVSLGFSSPA